MATRAHSTRAPLLPSAATVSPLLGSGFGKQPGPVTQAIRAMRAAEPVGTEIISVLPPDTSDLRRQIAERIEADIALLDMLNGDADLEPKMFDASASEWAGCGVQRFNVGGAA